LRERGVLVRRARERVVEGYRESLDVGQSQGVKKEEEGEEGGVHGCECAWEDVEVVEEDLVWLV